VEKRPFGPARVPVPVIGEGTWRIERDDRAEAVAAIRAALDLGMGHIDTAEMYGDGRAEEIVAEAIAGRRAEAFLVTKVMPQNATAAGVVRSCEKSLARLRTDHVDLYLLHWPGDHPLEATIGAFEELVAAGKIRSWGLSNFDVHELEDAIRIAGEGRIACNQVLYHLGERGIEHRVIPSCEAHGIPVVAYSPFGQGDFPSLSRGPGRVLQEIAAAHGATARQVALRFLVRRPSLFTIPKAGTPAHVRDNAAAAALVLTEDELGRIDQAFPVGPPPRELPTL
jgi:diketogulonate reductase-like aldo/keto reductase